MAIPDLVFTSHLDCSHREALEQLLFHNKNQAMISDGILCMIERYQTPRISVARNGLWITFDSGIEAQSLFVLRQAGDEFSLLGTIVYTREESVLAVIVLAVDENYTVGGANARENLFLIILDEVRKIARRIKGIMSIKLYLTSPPVTLAVRNTASSVDPKPNTSTPLNGSSV